MDENGNIPSDLNNGYANSSGYTGYGPGGAYGTGLNASQRGKNGGV